MVFTGSQYLDDTRFQIGLGQVKNVSGFHKFGAVPQLSTGQSGTIWDVNDTYYPWSAWDTAGTITVDRLDAGDAGKSVTIQGLDDNYLPVEDIVVLTGATGNAGVQSFKRIYRAFMHNGSGENAGVINIRKDGTIVASIGAGDAQTLMAIYTVPAKTSALWIKGVASCQNNGDAIVGVYVRTWGEQAFRIRHTFEVTAGSPYVYELPIPIAIEERADIDIRATARTNNVRITAAWDMALVKK